MPKPMPKAKYYITSMSMEDLSQFTDVVNCLEEVEEDNKNLDWEMGNITRRLKVAEKRIAELEFTLRIQNEILNEVTTT